MIVTVDRAADAWFDAMARWCAVTPQGWYLERGEALALVTGAASPSLNLVVSTSAVPRAPALEGTAFRVRDSGVPWSIMVRGDASDAIGELASWYGLTRRVTRPFMTCSAAGSVLRYDGEWRTRIRPVGPAESGTLTEVLADGLGFRPGSLMRGGVLDTNGFTAYLAEKGDLPVATGFTMRDGDAAGVFNVAVLRWARGHGLGRAVTAKAMADAFAAGAETAYLHPSTAARPLFESMGFGVAETWTAFTAD
jgi:predicted GNAT family acetyltransferase